MERKSGNHVADLIGETLPEVMEQLIREYPPKEGDISRIMQIPSSEIIKRMKGKNGKYEIRNKSASG